MLTILGVCETMLRSYPESYICVLLLLRARRQGPWRFGPTQRANFSVSSGRPPDARVHGISFWQDARVRGVSVLSKGQSFLLPLVDPQTPVSVAFSFWPDARVCGF